MRDIRNEADSPPHWCVMTCHDMSWHFVHEKANYKALTDSRPNPSISSSTAQFGCFLSWFSHGLMHGVPFCRRTGIALTETVLISKKSKESFLIIGILISSPVFPGKWGDVELGRHNYCIWYTCSCKQPVCSIHITTSMPSQTWVGLHNPESPPRYFVSFLLVATWIYLQTSHPWWFQYIPIHRVFFSLFFGVQK